MAPEQEDFDEFEDSPPPLEDREVEPAVPDQDLEQTLEDLEAAPPQGIEPPPDAEMEVPDVGQPAPDDQFSPVGFSIPPSDEFPAEALETPAEPFDATIIPPDLNLDEEVAGPPASLLEHLERLAGEGAEEGAVGDSGLPDMDFGGGDDSGGGGSGMDGAAQDLGESHLRNHDTIAALLTDHARRLDEITARMEQARL